MRAYHEGVNQSMSTEEAPAYTGRPVHGPESHGADAFRYLSMALPLLSNGPSDYYRSSGGNGGLRPTSCMVG